jgi:hypothetical protein
MLETVQTPVLKLCCRRSCVRTHDRKGQGQGACGRGWSRATYAGDEQLPHVTAEAFLEHVRARGRWNYRASTAHRPPITAWRILNSLLASAARTTRLDRRGGGSGGQGARTQRDKRHHTSSRKARQALATRPIGPIRRARRKRAAAGDRHEHPKLTWTRTPASRRPWRARPGDPTCQWQPASNQSP